MTKLSDLKQRWMSDPEFQAEYERLEPEFALAEQLIRARTQAGLSQQELARRMKTTQSAIARLESGGSMPTWRTLRRFGEATGHRVTIHLERDHAG